MTNRELEEIVGRVVREQLAPNSVEWVRVSPAIDYNGSDILDVIVTLPDDMSGINYPRMLGVVSRLRDALAESDVHAFPIIDYVSKSDAKRLGLGAA